jgi:hypothetical protein
MTSNSYTPDPGFRRCCLCCLGLFLLLAIGRPLAASELNSPYQLHIVLHVAEHRLLTPVFRDRVERELHDTVQAALGDLGQVTLLKEHPLLERVRTRGLQHALEHWKDTADVKTHFVLIDYSGSEYEIQARQHDGVTGLVSPCVRRDRTPDRDLVARTAALLLAQDFGLLGTIRKAPDARKAQGVPVEVELRGGGLAPLTGWVHKGDVFALVAPASVGVTVPEAFLQVTEPPREDARDGVCGGRFFHRYEQARSIVGYRCIKLGTVRTALRLRWMSRDDQGKLHPINGDLTLAMALRHHGFTGEEATLLSKTANPDGIVDTSRDGDKGVFDSVAFVTVTGGSVPEKLRPLVPIALVSDEPVLVPVTASQGEDPALAIDTQTWRNSVADSLLVQIMLFQEIKKLSDDPQKRSQVLDRAEQGLKRTHADYERLTTERDALRAEAQRQKTPLPNLDREEKRLRELKEGEDLLTEFVKKQSDILKEETDPKRRAQRDRVEQGMLMEKNLDIDGALAVYKKVLDEGFKDPGLQKHYDDLSKEWQPVDDRHRDARAFIYHTWPRIDLPHLKDRIPEARQNYLECKRAKDIRSIRKLFKATEAHAIALTQALKELHPESDIEDDVPAKQYKETSEALLRLADDIDGFLKGQG